MVLSPVVSPRVSTNKVSDHEEDVVEPRHNIIHQDEWGHQQRTSTETPVHYTTRDSRKSLGTVLKGQLNTAAATASRVVNVAAATANRASTFFSNIRGIGGLTGRAGSSILNNKFLYGLNGLTSDPLPHFTKTLSAEGCFFDTPLSAGGAMEKLRRHSIRRKSSKTIKIVDSGPGIGSGDGTLFIDGGRRRKRPYRDVEETKGVCADGNQEDDKNCHSVMFKSCWIEEEDSEEEVEGEKKGRTIGTTVKKGKNKNKEYFSSTPPSAPVFPPPTLAPTLLASSSPSTTSVISPRNKYHHDDIDIDKKYSSFNETRYETRYEAHVKRYEAHEVSRECVLQISPYSIFDIDQMSGTFTISYRLDMRVEVDPGQWPEPETGMKTERNGDERIERTDRNRGDRIGDSGRERSSFRVSKISPKFRNDECMFDLPEFLHKNCVELTVVWSDWVAERMSFFREREERAHSVSEDLKEPVQVGGEGEDDDESIVLEGAEGMDNLREENLKHTRKEKDVVKEQHDVSEDVEKTSVFVTKTQILTSQCRLLYDLTAFPFDCQTLEAVLLLMPKSSTNFSLDLVPQSHRALAAFEHSFENAEWTLVPNSFHVVQERTFAGERIRIRLTVRRLWKWYFWNFFLVFFLVTVTGWSAFCWNWWAISEQVLLETYFGAVAIASLTLLTNVNLKAWAASRRRFFSHRSLPRIAYMTLLDVYITVCLLCGVLLVGILACSMFGSNYMDPPKRDTTGGEHAVLDKSALQKWLQFESRLAILLLLLFVGPFHLWFIWQVRRYWKMSSRQCQIESSSVSKSIIG